MNMFLTNTISKLCDAVSVPVSIYVQCFRLKVFVALFVYDIKGPKRNWDMDIH